MLPHLCLQKGMMKFLKITGIAGGILVLLATLFYLYASYQVDQRLAARYSIQSVNLPIRSDSAAMAKGNHLVNIKGCRDCHGEDLSGKVFNDDILVGKLAGPNLTQGKGGLPDNYQANDWVKAIRHGVKRDDHPLIVMPSLETSKMSEEELTAMISYLHALPPVDNTVPRSTLGIMIKTMVYLDMIELIPAEQIDHTAPLVKRVDESAPLVLGKHLSAMCSGCHRENMKGGDAMAPGFPPVPDLTSTGVTGKWTLEQFMTTLRTGKRPDSTSLDPSMPVQMTKYYSDQELQALYTYFKNL
jgi:cytochrome c553